MTNLIKSPKAKSFGPIADLESLLPADWWQTLFSANYLRTDGDVVEDRRNTVADIDMILGAASPGKFDPILDLCCGQGRHSLELASRGFRRILGVDSSHFLIWLARRRAKKRGLDVSFREGDVRDLRLEPRTYKAILLMGNSFGYFEREEDDLGVIELLGQLASDGCVLSIDTTDGEWTLENYEPRSWEWISNSRFVCRERAISADRTRLICREIITDVNRGVIADQFYCERLYSRQKLRDLLEIVGFSDLIFHATPNESFRNQDLGMMGHRLFLTARKV